MSRICSIRAFRVEDRPYVVETWIGVAGRHSGAAIGQIKSTVAHVIATGEVRMAVVPEDDDAILGFLALDLRGDVAMAYTRRPARGLGICSALSKGIR